MTLDIDERCPLHFTLLLTLILILLTLFYTLPSRLTI